MELPEPATDFNWSLQRLLSGGDLSFAQTRAAMMAIMAGTVSPVRLAAWLAAMRVKGETAAEIAGGAAALIEHAVPVPCADPRAVDIVGTGGDHSGTGNFSTAAAVVAAGAGLTVAKHGNRAVSSRCGSADVLAALGLNLEADPAVLAAGLREDRIAFLFAPKLHPAMRHATPVRRELAARTIFNLLGPLANPARVGRLVIGVYAPPLCRLMAEACRELGRERVLVVHTDGLDELAPCGIAEICELRNGQLHEYRLDPQELGLPRCRREDLAGGDAAANAAQLRAILAGTERGSLRQVVCLNAAAALVVTEAAPDWPTALRLAEAAIDDGRAAARLAALLARNPAPPTT